MYMYIYIYVCMYHAIQYFAPEPRLGYAKYRRLHLLKVFDASPVKSAGRCNQVIQW